MNNQRTDLENVNMGELKVAAVPVGLKTILGSCIGLVIYDRQRKICGLAHIMLPESREESVALRGKFANIAVPALIADLVNKGCVRHALEAKIAGGAAMFALTRKAAGNMNVGERNLGKVEELLDREKIRVTGRDVGGSRGRRMQVDAETCAVVIEILGEGKKTI